MNNNSNFVNDFEVCIHNYFKKLNNCKQGIRISENITQASKSLLNICRLIVDENNNIDNEMLLNIFKNNGELIEIINIISQLNIQKNNIDNLFNEGFSYSKS